MLQLENVVLPKETDKNGIEVTATIEDFLVPLVEKLALNHPEWRFESYYCRKNYSSGVNGADFGMVVERLKVMDKYEELGQLGTDYTRSGKRFWVSNHRTEKLRERGSGMKTIHLDKAIKHVGKYFSKKNIGEKLREALQLARTNLDQVTTSKGWKMRELWNNSEISAELQRYLVSIFPDALTMLDPKIASKLEDFPIRVNELAQATMMHEAMQKHNMHLVLLDGMDYAIQKGNDAPTIKSSEQLPDYMRRAIGLLKLVEDNQIMQDIGFRVNETTFYVLNKEEV